MRFLNNVLLWNKFAFCSGDPLKYREDNETL